MRTSTLPLAGAVLGCLACSGGGGASTSGGTGCNGSVVPAQISTDLTLTAACSPYRVTGSGFVDVSGTAAPVLTIEPGVTLKFDRGTSLRVGESGPGTLVAAGTASAPIVFSSSAATPQPGDWGGIDLGPHSSAGGGSTLAFASIEYASGFIQSGGDLPWVTGALTVNGLGARGTPDVHVTLSDLTLSHNAVSGIVFFGPLAGFSEMSGNLAVPDVGPQGYPIVIGANQAGTVPTTLTLLGGGTVALSCQNLGEGSSVTDVNDCRTADLVSLSQTWPALPVPWSVLDITIEVAGGSSGAPTTLTIAAPNTLAFRPGSLIEVDDFASCVGEGQLIARGTPAAPIVFTAIDTSPPLYWLGIEFNACSTSELAGSVLSGCTIAYAANAPFQNPNLGPAAVCVVGATACGSPSRGPTIDHCTFTNYGGGCGIAHGDDVNEPSEGYQVGNTFSGGQGVCVDAHGPC